ncbi:universal stress protein [Thiomicrospira sp. ALE5]|uniref:universal stress protein n=1 Tax=Thiomicrospira sp. ALE5 TaxID=748650 RepID=UPI0008E02024|nr:universal stress protein [Thiomicrospira sp. ALE5]SFR49022.1 universal stress protein A [Thiomicrospira sp. ALE5]
MAQYHTLLVAVDFSSTSTKALARAQALADTFNATLHVLHVTELPSYPVLEDVAITGVAGAWVDELADKAVAAAEKRLNQLVADAGIAAESIKVVTGVPRRIIVEQAKACHADLIVVGRRGLSGLQRLLGSTADSVLHDASCDVLAVSLDD